MTDLLADIQWEASSLAWLVELTGLDLGCPRGHPLALREDSSWPLVMPDFSFVCIAFSEWRGWPMTPGSQLVSSSSFVLCQENANQLSPTHSYSPHLYHRNIHRDSQAPRQGLICICNPFPFSPPKKNMVGFKNLNIYFLRKSNVQEIIQNYRKRQAW